MNEIEYRTRLQAVLARIENALADVDPDVIECEQSNGVLTMTFANQSRCILSGQPSVQQLWLALAAKGRAYHFNFNEAVGQWVDDKDPSVELIALTQNFLKELTGLEVRF